MFENIFFLKSNVHEFYLAVKQTDKVDIFGLQLVIFFSTPK